jgi:hypothetical protein
VGNAGKDYCTGFLGNCPHAPRYVLGAIFWRHAANSFQEGLRAARNPSTRCRSNGSSMCSSERQNWKFSFEGFATKGRASVISSTASLIDLDSNFAQHHTDCHGTETRPDRGLESSQAIPSHLDPDKRCACSGRHSASGDMLQRSEHWHCSI